MINVENLKMRYNLGWIRIDQLKRYVQLGAINEAEYKEVCGLEYEV